MPRHKEALTQQRPPRGTDGALLVGGVFRSDQNCEAFCATISRSFEAALEDEPALPPPTPGGRARSHLILPYPQGQIAIDMLDPVCALLKQSGAHDLKRSWQRFHNHDKSRGIATIVNAALCPPRAGRRQAWRPASPQLWKQAW